MREHSLLRMTRAAWVALMLSITVVIAFTAASASATPLETLKAQARAADAEVNAKYEASEKQIEAYNAVHGRYLHTRSQYRATLRAVKIAQQNLGIARARLADSLTKTYKSGQPDPVAYMLASKSIGDLVNQVQLYDRTNADNSQLLHQITQYRTVIAHKKAVLKKQTARLQTEDAQSKAAETAAVDSLHAAQAYKASLNVKIRAEIAREEAAAQARAAAAAAAAARQTTTTTTTTTTGGGGGGGGGGGNYSGSLPPVASSSLGGQAVAIAQQYLGVPYVYGGASPSGFDCSGLVMYVYGKLGVSLPHNAAAQYGALPHVSLSALQPGDLVFFYGFGHVGIYVGNNTVIHAPHTGSSVSYENMSYMGPIAAARVPG